ncbi:MAG: putative signal transduction histidine kinase [Ilumatobacteraceae bacterium]|nr:putative signal transduction histidine kinase [Ilumatobacteraceae bacterium]
MPDRFAFSGPKQLLRLLDAVMAIGSELSLSAALRRITHTAAELVDAKYAALGVLDASGTMLAEFITVGLTEEETARIGALPDGHGILGLLIVEPKPLRLPDIHEHPDSFGFPPGHPPMTSFLGVPILLRGKVFGNLYLTDKHDGQVFTDVDQELAVGLAAAAGLAIENARLNEQARTATLLDERERIARDLHDDVIQRLFATGLSLQAAAQMVREPVAVERIMRAVDDLDTSIRQVRSTIFELHHRFSGLPSLRSDILDVCNEATRALGFEPRCEISGPVDSTVSDSMHGHIMLCLREALSNVARHANATRVDVSVTSDRNVLALRIADDGTGYSHDPARSSSGLVNMRTRAEAVGGTFTISGRPDGGTLVVWEAPVGQFPPPSDDLEAAPRTAEVNAQEEDG